MTVGRHHSIAALWKVGALYLLSLCAALPLIALSAPPDRATLLVLSIAVLYLVPYGVAASEEGKEGLISAVAYDRFLSLGVLVFPVVGAMVFYQQTGHVTRSFGVLLLGALWVQAFLCVERGVAHAVVIGTNVALVIGGVVLEAPFAKSILPLSFTLLSVAFVLDHMGEQLRRHGRSTTPELAVPSATASVLVIGALMTTTIVFQLVRVFGGPEFDPIELSRSSLAPQQPRVYRPIAAPGMRERKTPTTPVQIEQPPDEAPSTPAGAEPEEAPETTLEIPEDQSEVGPEEEPAVDDEGPQANAQTDSAGEEQPPEVGDDADESPSDEEEAPETETPDDIVTDPDGVTTGDYSYFSAEQPIEQRSTWQRLRPVLPQLMGVVFLIGTLVALRRRGRRQAADVEEEDADDLVSAETATTRSQGSRRFQRSSKDPRTRIIQLYNQVCDEGRVLGLGRHLSAEEVTTRLTEALPDAQFHVLILARAFEQAKYSRQKITAELSGHAEEAAGVILSEIKGRAA